jgi:hypothetical protein
MLGRLVAAGLAGLHRNVPSAAARVGLGCSRPVVRNPAASASVPVDVYPVLRPRTVPYCVFVSYLFLLHLLTCSSHLFFPSRSQLLAALHCGRRPDLPIPVDCLAHRPDPPFPSRRKRGAHGHGNASTTAAARDGERPRLWCDPTTTPHRFASTPAHRTYSISTPLAGPLRNWWLDKEGLNEGLDGTAPCEPSCC